MRHLSSQPLYYKTEQLNPLRIFPCNLSQRYRSDLLILQMGKQSSMKLYHIHDLTEEKGDRERRFSTTWRLTGTNSQHLDKFPSLLAHREG